MRYLAGRNTVTFLSALLTGAGITAGTPTASQTADGPKPSDAQLVEIVVTAQRRSENLQSVPISAQVIGGQQLVNQNLSNLQDLSQIVPSVHVSAGGATSDMYIRGIGSGNQQSFDQSVGTFVDDIYHGRARSSTNTFFDVDRIEVLKGPQSTFFGNNAIAGALDILTKRPSNTFEASARALYGMYGQYAFEGAAGGPINDVLAVRLAAIVDGADRWIKNVNTHEYGPREYNTAARVSLALSPPQPFHP